MNVPQLFSLAKRSALVTGSSRGIGKAIARAFAEAGAKHVCLCARHEDALQAAAKEIGAGVDTQVHYRAVDMRDRKQVADAAAWASDQTGHIDILVNNAGNNRPEPLLETTDEAWDEVLELNVTSCMILARALAKSMVERKWGRILHLSSVMALASNPGRGNYSATKAALIGMSRAHALELGPHRVTVNCLAPGPIMTDLPMSLLTPEQKQSFADRTALKRWGQPIDMVGPALMLASEAGAFITGAVILADGGLVCRTF